MDEVNWIIDGLDANASTELDGISTKTIKCMKYLTVGRLLNSINVCFVIGIFLLRLKLTK